MVDINLIQQKVCDLLGKENAGHGFDHVERVWQMSKKLLQKIDADNEIVELAALLHDADDYKFFGEESAANLTNARRIMSEALVDEEKAQKVCDIISNMGYSKLLAGVRPQTIEGKIVSDADMLDAIGINGIIRTLQFAFVRYQKYGLPMFDKNLWPQLNLSAEEYKNKIGNCVNHFFEKTLKLKFLMLTEVGKQEALCRHNRMVMFLEGFFDENNVPEWQEYLQNYLLEQESKN